MSKITGFRGLVSFVFVLAFSLVSPSFAQEKGWEKEWATVLAAARKEGRVVVQGEPDPVVRRELLPKFTGRFGIRVEFIAGRTSQVVARVRMERRAKVYTVDVFLAGPGSSALVLYPEKMIDPLKPLLILPEVVDPSKWKPGKLWFNDPEDRFTLRLFSNVSTMLHVNTNYVRPEEIRSAKDLLNPKWKGKMASADPKARGRAQSRAAAYYTHHGEEFLKRLYADQKVRISGTRRQLHDWLARGTYPICLSCSEGYVKPLRKEGFPIATIYRLSDVKSDVSSSPFQLSIANKRPHPNAARVFVNWLASKEGVEIYARGYGTVPLRNDIDESFLPQEIIPKPGVSYFDGSDWRYVTQERRKLRRRVRNILREAMSSR